MRAKNNTRPAATEAQIREMHDRAAGHASRAAQHEANAARIIGEAEQGAQEMVASAGRKAEETLAEARRGAAEHIENARAMAAQMITNAETQAEAQVSAVRADADENVRKAHLVAQQERDMQAAEQRDQQYWALLAAEETAHAGLPPVMVTAPIEQVPAVTRTDGEVARDV